jgi:hypothetical protein
MLAANSVWCLFAGHHVLHDADYERQDSAARTAADQLSHDSPHIEPAASSAGFPRSPALIGSNNSNSLELDLPLISMEQYDVMLPDEEDNIIQLVFVKPEDNTRKD